MTSLNARILSLLPATHAVVDEFSLFQFANDISITNYEETPCTTLDSKPFYRVFDYFVDSRNDELARRGAGMVLLALISTVLKNTDDFQSLLSEAPKQSLGTLILSTQPDPTKIIAGMLIRDLASKSEFLLPDFWPGDQYSSLEPFPTGKNTEWLFQFNDFLDRITENELAAPTEDESFWAPKIFADGGSIFPEAERHLVSVGSSYVNFVSMLSPDRLQFVDLPKANILNASLAKDTVRNSSTQNRSSQAPYAVAIRLSHNGPGTYMRNAEWVSDKKMQVQFVDFDDAKNFIRAAMPPKPSASSAKQSKQNCSTSDVEDERIYRKTPVIHFSQDGPKNQGKRPATNFQDTTHVSKQAKVDDKQTESNYLVDYTIAQIPVEEVSEDVLDAFGSELSDRVDSNGSPYPKHVHLPLPKIQHNVLEQESDQTVDWLTTPIKPRISPVVAEEVTFVSRADDQDVTLVADEEPPITRVINHRTEMNDLNKLEAQSIQHLQNHRSDQALGIAQNNSPSSSSDTAGTNTDEDSSEFSDGSVSEGEPLEQTNSTFAYSPHLYGLAKVLERSSDRLLCFLDQVEDRNAVIIAKYGETGKELIAKRAADSHREMDHTNERLLEAKTKLSEALRGVLDGLDHDMSAMEQLSEQYCI